MHDTSANICIIGAGPIGIAFAGALSAQHRVWLLPRSNLSNLREQAKISLQGSINREVERGGIQIISAQELTTLPKNISFWLALKSYDLRKALFDLKPYLSRHTPLVLLSNGIGIYADAKTIIGRDVPALRALPGFGAISRTATEVTIYGMLTVQIAGTSEDTPILNYISKALSVSGFQITIEKDIATAEWKKLLVNLVVNTLCTLAGEQNSCVVVRADLKERAIKILKEARAVAKCEGFALNDLSNEVILDKILSHGENLNSTLLDVQRGKETELPFMLGRFLKLAKAYNVNVPTCTEVALELGEKYL